MIKFDQVEDFLSDLQDRLNFQEATIKRMQIQLDSTANVQSVQDSFSSIHRKVITRLISFENILR